MRREHVGKQKNEDVGASEKSCQNNWIYGGKFFFAGFFFRKKTQVVCGGFWSGMKKNVFGEENISYGSRKVNNYT